jgi:acetyl-CoA C-acetyltransferase
MIADPLTLLQCCPVSDGAAAAVVGRQRGRERDIDVIGAAFRTGRLWDHRSEHAYGFELVRDTSADAFAEAGVNTAAIDVFEVHDAFTIGEILAAEALGLAQEGHGGELTAQGDTTLTGAHPINPSGGLLSRGHPYGATGVAQLAEIVWQLRGDAGSRQVKEARVGAIETIGGGVSGIDGNACVVAVLAG